MKKNALGIVFVIIAVVFLISGFSSAAEHSTLGGIALFLLFGILGLKRLGILGKIKVAPIQKANTLAESRPAPAPSQPMQPAASAAPDQKTVFAPNEIDGCQASYQYHKVVIQPCQDLDVNSLVLGSKLSFAKGDTAPSVLLDGREIGSLIPGHISDMVNDWLKRGDPMCAILESIDPGTKAPQMFLVFYRDLINVAERRGLSRIKLVGNTNADAQDTIASIEKGNLCFATFDYDKEKWEISCGFSTIGYLPAKYDANSITDDNKIVIAEVEENNETEKHCVWVYIL